MTTQRYAGCWKGLVFQKRLLNEQHIRYYLPPHTYFTSTERDKTHVIEVGKKERYSLFVTKSDAATWNGFERA